jgi:hypothetical protein
LFNSLLEGLDYFFLSLLISALLTNVQFLILRFSEDKRQGLPVSEERKPNFVNIMIVKEFLSHELCCGELIALVWSPIRDCKCDEGLKT